MKYNPFRPGQLITPGLFAGRVEELMRLEKALVQAKNGNPSHFALVGERGIGKSSLMLFLEYVSEGKIESIKNGRFSFLTVSVVLTERLSEMDILCSIGSALQTKLKDEFKITSIAQGAWDFLSKWEVLGVAYHSGNKVDAMPFELREELTHTLVKASEQIVKRGKDGLLILIDEADKPDSTSGLGTFLKLTTEQLSKKGANNILFGLAGLTEVFDVLRKSHESSPRIFDPIELKPLTHTDQESAIHKGLLDANSKNAQDTTITSDACDSITQHAEGFPQFLQQFAYSSFEADKDNLISVEDVENGAFGKGGAIDCLGLRYFRDIFWHSIQSDDYRRVLRAMSIDGKKWVTKSTIRERSKVKEAVLNNAINALKDRKIIVPRPGKQGSYRLTSDAFAKWINREKDE